MPGWMVVLKTIFTQFPDYNQIFHLYTLKTADQKDGKRKNEENSTNYSHTQFVNFGFNSN